MDVQYIDKFEYIYKQFSAYSMSKIINEMNELGKEGWELISILKDEIGRSRYIFKRKITETKIQ